jgi:hypothetical protein
MGLCKCSLRRVTNLFCFEHRVNVCESCLISNHESCVIQTYVAWLTDSDYDPNCLLCSQSLHKTGAVIRLKCFHVFHWDCLNARMSQLPLNSASYKCPSCLDNIFPSPNQTSPVIEKLKSRLATVNWGRNGIGLDMRPEFDTPFLQNGGIQQSSQHQHLQQPSSLPASGRATPALTARDHETAYAVNVENPIEMNTFTSRSKGHAADRRPLLSQNHDEDHPDQKYAKRLGTDRHVKISNVPRSVKRIAAIAIIAAIVVTLIYFVGRHSERAENNPLFDPHANPNIRIGDSNNI